MSSSDSSRTLCRTLHWPSCLSAPILTVSGIYAHTPSRDTPEKIKHTSWVYRVWGGRVRSRVVCSRCNNPSDTFDSFLDLSLDVNKQGKKSVLGMLAGFTKEDKLEGDNKYHCEKWVSSVVFKSLITYFRQVQM